MARVTWHAGASDCAREAPALDSHGRAFPGGGTWEEAAASCLKVLRSCWQQRKTVNETNSKSSEGNRSAEKGLQMQRSMGGA
ncbi:hypothetical protein NDU88_000701 [Pleurodeles waltl]|uniref:Uncharacterized protein n=1 Tax=Pleurodeles waltl TaxID=8319 RepID=A0AAV7MJC6_PLEWA|nr:hypothetical protein NDU88_000701 [Pleurodeles waltl]